MTQPLDHSVSLEQTLPRGGRSSREETQIICSCAHQCSATGPVGTTRDYVRGKFNQHLSDNGLPAVFNDLPEGSASTVVEDQVTGQQRFLVDGGVNLDAVVTALDEGVPWDAKEELVPPPEIEIFSDKQEPTGSTEGSDTKAEPSAGSTSSETTDTPQA